MKELVYYFISMLGAGLIGAIIVITILHSCYQEDSRSVFQDWLCGDIGQYGGASLWLNPKESIARVYSNNITENIADRQAKNLVDGDTTTLAHTGSNRFDYIIELTDKFLIKKVELFWLDYGLKSSTGHYDHWALEIKDKKDNWLVVAEGQTPEEKVTVVKVGQLTDALRIRAEAAEAWIGIFDMRITGKAR